MGLGMDIKRTIRLYIFFQAFRFYIFALSNRHIYG